MGNIFAIYGNLTMYKFSLLPHRVLFAAVVAVAIDTAHKHTHTHKYHVNTKNTFLLFNVDLKASSIYVILFFFPPLWLLLIFWNDFSRSHLFIGSEFCIKALKSLLLFLFSLGVFVSQFTRSTSFNVLHRIEYTTFFTHKGRILFVHASRK